LKSPLGIQLIKFKKKSLSGSSKRWLQRQHNDELVIKAKKLGYRSRAVFKLEEINQKLKILKRNDIILDLGSSPGSWSQFLRKKGYDNIIAVDILEMEKIDKVHFIFGDFTEDDIQEQIRKIYKNVDVILSDIAANTTGNKKLDSFKTNSVCLEVLDFAYKFLGKNGRVLCKFFNGELDKDIILFSKMNFKKNKIIKPSSSRKDSKENYIYCEI
jgi:cell division protein FtsJ